MSTKKRKKLVSIDDSKESNELETEDIYDDKQREEMLQDDEITASEDGFMRGRDMKSQTAKRLKKSSHEDSLSVELTKEEYRDD